MLTKILITAVLYAAFAFLVLALAAKKRKKTGAGPTKAKVREILLVGAAGSVGLLLASTW
ncbi:TPA: hypothetical protein NNM78_002262 [Pseudomonas aeruginosa]|nr:hypothetical protein [Pseudomonas aeruginosa]